MLQIPSQRHSMADGPRRALRSHRQHVEPCATSSLYMVLRANDTLSRDAGAPVDPIVHGVVRAPHMCDVLVSGFDVLVGGTWARACSVLRRRP